MRVILSFIVLGLFLFVSVDSLWAVKAPSVEVRKKSEVGRLKDDRQKAKAQRSTGCKYGKDAKTGKCYEPKEGQFYRDPATGEVKVKKIEKVNLPWHKDAKSTYEGKKSGK